MTLTRLPDTEWTRAGQKISTGGKLEELPGTHGSLGHVRMDISREEVKQNAEAYVHMFMLIPLMVYLSIKLRVYER